MLRIAGRLFNPRLVIFDKDGTLLAFAALWHAWFERVSAGIEHEVALHEQTRVEIAAVLGYDRSSGAWDPRGPLTVAATSEVVTLLAGQLYRGEGLAWEQAGELVRRVESRVRATLPVAELTQPIGDARGLLVRLSEAGYTLALATTDERALTAATLRAAGLEDLFAASVCGDDGLPLKPAPDMALAICRRLNIAPGEALMVGDTVADLLMARSAGLMAGVGVSSGATPAEVLQQETEWVIGSIHEIEVI